MLRITLYKNCILNETYQNVISTGLKNGISVLERYLETCSPYKIDDIDETYYRNSGILNFDLELVNNTNIYEYNYMKILYYDEEGSLKLLRYCFIQDIKVNNELVQLYYTEDIFSSYADKITTITESYLSRSRRLRYINKTISLHTLPINYDGNNNIGHFTLESFSEFCIIASIQYYDTATIGTNTKRYYGTFLLGRDNITTTLETTTHSVQNTFSLNEAISYVNEIVVNQSKGKNAKGSIPNNIGVGFTEYYYSVKDFIIIPKGYVMSYFDIYTPTGVASNWYYGLQLILDSTFYWFDTSGVQVLGYPIKANYKNKLLTIKSITANNNFKRLSLGTFNTQIPTINNGTSINIDIEIKVENASCQVFLNCQNQLIDITSDFTYEVPYTALLGEENSLNRISRILNNVNELSSLGLNMVSGGMSIADNIDKINGLNNKISLLAFTKKGNLTRSPKKLEKIQNFQERILGLESENINERLDLFANENKGIISLIENNLPLYTTNKGTFAKSSAALNCELGLREFTILSDNDDFVLKTINNTGYVVYEYCNDLNMVDFNNADSFTTANINYDIIKFDTINIIGSFPRTIALQLNEIFENGFKIWYNENLQDDNLGVR